MTGRRVRALAAVATLVVAVLAVAAIVALRAPAPRGAPELALVDQYGRTFTLAAQRGRAVVLFFGYTRCADVCPTTLASEERAIRGLGARGRDVEVAFVTVDPAHDDANALRRYAAAFGPNVFGLRGTPAELARVYADYRVDSRPVAPRRGVAAAEIEHSTAIYYVSRDGELAAYGDSSDARGTMAADVAKAAG